MSCPCIWTSLRCSRGRLAIDTQIDLRFHVFAQLRNGDRLSDVANKRAQHHCSGTVARKASRHEVEQTLLVELARSAASTFDRVAFLSGHAGNATELNAAVRQLRDEGHDAVGLVPTWPGPRDRPIDAHAGRTETSLLLHVSPDQVRIGRQEVGETRPLADLLDQLMVDGVAALSPNGVLGDPTGATADEGRHLLDDLIWRTVALLGPPRTR